MQFELNHNVGNSYVTIRFNTLQFKQAVRESFFDSFKRIGGIVSIGDLGWNFPLFINSETISEIIRNTCFVCGGQMYNSTALQNSLVSFDDFGNDAGQRGSTQSRVGDAIQINVRKCINCGHSHT